MPKGDYAAFRSLDPFFAVEIGGARLCLARGQRPNER